MSLPVLNPVIAPTQPGRRVLLVTNIPTPYRIPLFNELNAQFAALGISFKVVFAALGYPRRKWEIDMTQCSFPWEVLHSGRFFARNPESAMFTFSGLGRVLSAEHGAVVIVAGFSLATTRLWLRSLLRRTKYLIWSGAVHRKGHPDSSLRRWLRRRLVARASGFIAYGTRAAEYLRGLAATPSLVSIGINTVDTTYFQREAARVRAETATLETDPKRILYVGNLEPGKRLDQLLAAIQILARSRRDFVLDLVGSGSQESYLRQFAERLGIAACVRFHGFLQRPDVVRHLALTSCFAFPSEYDVWGLVLVEAMAAGVPCVSSVQAGATPDLIQDGVTGFAVDFSQTQRVAERLAWLFDHPEECLALGNRAAKFIKEQVNINNSAAGFVTAIQNAFGVGPSASAASWHSAKPDQSGRPLETLSGR